MVSQYRESGVDLDAAGQLVEKIKLMADRTKTAGVVSGIGGFSGLFSMAPFGCQDLVLAAGADGVGTKIKIAQALGKHDTVGIDLVAMNADDVVTCGAQPIFFLDYIAVGKLEPKVVEDIIAGVARGCMEAGCALLGGETAQMPDVYGPGEYDLAGFCVGAVKRNKIIDGSRIRAGDLVLGMASSGLHSNGYSLARKVLLERAGMSLEAYVPELRRTLGEELLEPTRIYAKVVLDLAARVDVHGLAHITGGGLSENVPRILPPGLSWRMIPGWPVPPIFDLIRSLGNVPSEEMLRVFNMGIGMVAVLAEGEVHEAVSILRSHGVDAFVIGEVTNLD